MINKLIMYVLIWGSLFQIANADQSFDTLVYDNYTIISNREYFNELKQIIPDVNNECNRLTGKLENQKQIDAYFFKTKEEYVEYYKKSFGKNPVTGDGGRCIIKKNSAILFGYREIGFGSITHELVHAVIVPDWPEIPGWFNEALAQALGAPSQSIGAVAASKELIEKGEYYTLKALFNHFEKEYLHHINREIIIDLGKIKVAGGIWLIGHSFVYYLKEKGFLGEFYRTYRDEFCFDLAIKNIGFRSISEMQKDFYGWLRDTKL